MQPTHDFTLQAVMEMQKSLGEMSSDLKAMKGSLDGVKAKVDDLVAWKHKILGGVAVIGAVCALLGAIVVKGWDYVSFKTPASTSGPTPAAAAGQAPAGPVAKP